MKDIFQDLAVEMKNGDLIIFGREAGCFIPEFIDDGNELSEFEFQAYKAYDKKYGHDALGHDACSRDGIDNLADLFGQEFSDRLLKRRWKLLARERLTTAIEEHLALTKRIDELNKFVENPTPNYEDIP